MLLPALQQAFGIEQNVHALGQKGRDQLRIALDAQAVARCAKGSRQADVQQRMRLVDQRRCAHDGSQRVTVELEQALSKQGFGGLQ